MIRNEMLWRRVKSFFRIYFFFLFIIFIIFCRVPKIIFESEFIMNKEIKIFNDLIIPPIGKDISNFKYKHVLNRTQCLNRKRARIELLQFVNKTIDPKLIKKPQTLIVGVSTIVGAQLKQILAKKGESFLAIGGINEVDFTHPHAAALFENITIKKAYIPYQPPLMRHTQSDGSEYLKNIINKYIAGLTEFLLSRNVPYVFATSQPIYDETLSILLKNHGCVVEMPYLVDSELFKDIENPTMRAVRECRKVGYTNVEYAPFKEFHSISSKDAAKFLIKQLQNFKNEHILIKGYSRMDVKSSIQVALKSVGISKCSLHISSYSHTINPLSIPDKVKYIGSQNDSVSSMIFNAYSNFSRPEKKRPYLTFLTTGRNDQYSKNFETRIQNYLKTLSYGVKQSPLANIEVLIVDYGTPENMTSLGDVLHVEPYLKGKMRFIIVPQKFIKWHAKN